MVYFLARNSLEVAFVYPSPERPSLDVGTYLALLIAISLGQAGLFIISIITGIALLKRQAWALFVGIGLHVTVFSIYLVSVVFLPPYGSNAEVAAIVISFAPLYLMSRRDVRSYLNPVLRA
jgi:hypothetical protein